MLTTEPSAIFRPVEPNDLSGLEDFLSKNKASTTFDTRQSSLPYIIVERSLAEPKKKKDVVALEKQVKAIFKQVKAEIERIKNDPKIPTRGKQATELEAAVPNKLFLRTKAASEATAQIKDLALKANETEGYWQATQYRDVLDSMFAKLCRSLIGGPLSETSARAVTVSTISPFMPQKLYHDIFIVYPNVYDEESTTEIAQILMKNHHFQQADLRMGARSLLYQSCKITKAENEFKAMIWSLTDLDFRNSRPTTNKRKAEDDFSNEAGPSKTNQAAADTPPDTKTTPEKKFKPEDAELESPFVQLQPGPFRCLPPPPPPPS